MEKIIYGANIGYVKKRSSKPIPKKTNVKLPEIYGANVGFKQPSKPVVEIIPSTVEKTPKNVVAVEKPVQETIEEIVDETSKIESWKAKREKRKQTTTE